jgi:hypothetical protein
MPYDTPSTAYGTLSYHAYDPFNSLYLSAPWF